MQHGFVKFVEQFLTVPAFRQPTESAFAKYAHDFGTVSSSLSAVHYRIGPAADNAVSYQ